MIVQKENIEDIWDELVVNFKLHWKETESYRHDQPFKPDKERFIQYSKMGVFHVFTARVDGELVGNFTIYTMPSMHTQEMVATEDTMFVKKEFRGKRVFFTLANYVHEELRKMGVKEITVTSKVSNPVGGLIERMGYNLVANEYSKSLVGADSAIAKAS